MKLLNLFLLVTCSSLFAQSGPGGVSIDLTNDSDCKVWFDAGSLDVSDGSSVNVIYDLSNSSVLDSAFQEVSGLQPIYRSAAAASINGRPVLKFTGGKYLKMQSTTDINNGGVRTERTTFMAFRTGADVSTFQMLYEQGGGWRGMNIYIQNGNLYIGGYDTRNDADGTPPWGASYTSTPISPQTTYILSKEYFVSSTGVTTGTISGWINGVPFTSGPATTVGSIWAHGDQPGLGAVNGDALIDGLLNAPKPAPFLGDFAEFIAYDKKLNEAERIIVQNYLAAKYSANSLVNDVYDHQGNYPFEVIGVGQDVGTTEQHNLSQGRNPFRISANALSDNSYFLLGHDNVPADQWTNAGLNDKYNTYRLERTWKVDLTGSVGDVTLEVDSNLLPTLPLGHKYVLLIESSGGLSPNWNAAKVYELSNGGSGDWFGISTAIPNNAFITIGTVAPTFYFEYNQLYAFETESDDTHGVQVLLNYIPQSDNLIDFNYQDQSAALTQDFQNFNFTTTINYPAWSEQVWLSFEVVGDLIAENSEDFLLELLPTYGNLVEQEVLVFTIYDNDNIPKFSFDNSVAGNLIFNENDGTVSVRVLRTGSSAGTNSVRYKLRNAGGSGTATKNTDYIFNWGTLTFNPGETVKTFTFDIIDDLIKENNETVIFELSNPSSGSDIASTDNETTITIVDNDSDPVVNFEVVSGFGPESNGQPAIKVLLSNASASMVSVNYVITGGSATAGVDYTLADPGVIQFAPGDTVEFIPIIVSLDEFTEADETVDLELTAVNNAVLGTSTAYTYTITDYVDFEWLGVAGVGLPNDNYLWLEAEGQSTADLNPVPVFEDLSPNGNNIVIQNNTTNQALKRNGQVNGWAVLDFYGNQFYNLSSDLGINSVNSAPFTSKDIFIAFMVNNASQRQVLYSQGGGTRGLVIYIENERLYFNVYNNANDFGAGSAWGTGSADGSVFVAGSTPIVSGQYYVLSAQYNGTQNNTLELYLNGNLEGSASALVTPAYMYNHNAGTLGELSTGVKFADGSSNAYAPFNGQIMEFLYFNNDGLNDTRRIILEEHLADKYNLNYTNPIVSTENNYYFETAGIGQLSKSDRHLDSRGKSLVRINAAQDLSNNEFFFWGHNNGDLSSYNDTDIPTGIHHRMNRVWLASEQGDVGLMDVTFDISNYSITDINALELLIDRNDGVFIDAERVITGRTFNAALTEVTFSGVNIQNGEWFTLASVAEGQPLPVELISFEVETEGNTAFLNWSCATETNNDYFELFHQAPGSEMASLTKITGAGNTVSTTSYNYEHLNLKNGLHFYQLFQVDYDGSRTLVGTQIALVEGPNEYLIYPNPSRNHKVNVQKKGQGRVNVKVLSLSGRVLYEQEHTQSLFQIELDESVNKGVYIIQIQEGTELENRKWIISN